MRNNDKILGMDRLISRRDVLQGIGAITAGAIAPMPLFAEASKSTTAYPPALTGLRGNHTGSFEVAHQLGREGRRDWGQINKIDNDIYDLIIVGAGISGLSAAHFHKKQHPEARILIVDNHDDFGGHAKRNEFEVGNQRLIGYGGAQTLQEPSYYSEIVKSLLIDLGIKVKRFEQAYDQKFYQHHGLRAGIHFNKKVWGEDTVVPYDLGTLGSYLPLANTKLSVDQVVAKLPISEAARKEFKRLLSTEEDQIPEIKTDDKKNYLRSLSYRDFLIRHLNITEPEVFAILQDLVSDFGLGIEAVTALSALNYAGLPGWDAAGLPDTEDEEAYIHHFPDGNASVARLIVRKLIPAVTTGTTMEDIGLAKFDYSKLDQPDSTVRLRLNSTVTQVIHDGEPSTAKQVKLSYVHDNKAFQVKGRSCILACNNSIIPYMCPELPKTQRNAMTLQVKTPILYTNVALRNWKAWKNLGIGAVISPGDYHINAMLDFPVSLGDYQFSKNADEPIIVHMERFPHRNNEGLTPHEQKRLGRHELLTTSFETIERNTRSQLTSMLGAGGFDPARDITGITVNRWAHGYASWYNPLFDTVYEDWQDERYPHMQARKPFGRIRIANSDSAATAMFEAAVEQGHRAVMELDS